MTSPSTAGHIQVSNALWDTTISTLATLHQGSSNRSTKFDPELEKYVLFHVAYFLNSYYLWIVFAFGFPGNIVSFMTILRMKPFTSPTRYVATLAFVDNVCLLCKILFFSLTKFDVNIGNRGCAFANWLLVAMTVERCLAICLPLKVGSICTRYEFTLILLTAYIQTVLFSICFHFAITSEMIDKNGDYKCQPSGDYDWFMRVWYWLDAVIYAFLPALLLIVLNALIIKGIRHSAIVQRELTSKASQVAETTRQQRQITIMLVVVCIAYVLLITPLALFYAIQPYWSYKQNPGEHAKYLFINQLAFMLSDSTHAVNFYLYFFSTQRFRKRCLETLFFCCLPRRQTRRFRGSTISGMSKAFRLSVTDDTTAHHNTVQLANLSSSSSSSSNHLLVGNGDNSMTRLKRGRDCSLTVA
ncbi:unnamed protein product [Candidula unifasciata]|uniref:G-protein coupled receptors family 1 profile domain-containing protein n=1 Tax=Candidula unifasciata TaxID=100452 RepID=A0A8S3ZW47_9EUPU|nr:unnamed protein product [Candidula unifasciata]